MTEEKKETETAVQVFATSSYVGKNTVYGWLKEAVLVAENHTLTKEALIQKMSAEYKPKTASKFGPSYVQSYVRAALAKGILTTDKEQAVSTYPEAPAKEKVEGEKAPKAKKEKKTKAGKEAAKLTEGEQAVLSVLMADTEASDIEAGIFRQSVTEVSESLATPEKTVAKNVALLVKKEFVVAVAGEGEAVLIRLTQKGYDYANKPKIEQAA